MNQEIEQKVETAIGLRLKEVGIDDKRPFEMLFKLSTCKKMTLDKFGEEHWEEDNGTQLKVASLILELTGQLDKKIDDMPKEMVHKISPDDILRLENISRELKGLETRLMGDKVQQGVIDVTASIS